MTLRNIILFFVLSPICAYSQWFTQTSGTSRHLIGMDMIDLNTGYICGDLIGGILKTTNSGQNWIIQPEPLIHQYNSISFIDNNTGIAVGPSGMILRTTNGGQNWLVLSRPGGDMGDVQFVNNNILYACGDHIIKSTNGGINWNILITAQFLGQFRSLFFTNELTGTIVGINGTIWTTTNGGINYIQRYMMLPVQFADSSLYDIQYINSTTGYISGNLGIVVKTTNSGVNWSYLPTGTITQFPSLYFINENIGYLAGTAGRLFKTTNGGVNWIQQTVGVTDSFYDLEFINYNTGWICGQNGRILKTTNGGSTWIKPINTEVPESYALRQNFPNPFNQVTKIQFEIPESKFVTLIVYDILGKEIAALVNEKLSPGKYVINFNENGLSSGIYFCKLQTNNYSAVKKMVLIR
ncbi:MAG: T9SS type A sorting domain-containing protein [Ignavibacteria bacterium]|nr:T9SS type A sorting domain-containing protein [Ignavibacteria bacterium]